MIEWDSPDKFIGTTAALILAGTAAASAGSQIYGAKKAAGAAKQAGQLQSDAATRAADLQYQATQDSLGYLRDESQFNRQQQAPYRAIGKGAINTLSSLTGVPMDYSGQDYPQSQPIRPPQGGGNTLGSMGQPPAPTPSQGPPMGQRRQFPNGKVGVWDGQGWVAQ